MVGAKWQVLNTAIEQLQRLLGCGVIIAELFERFVTNGLDKVGVIMRKKRGGNLYCVNRNCNFVICFYALTIFNKMQSIHFLSA